MRTVENPAGVARPGPRSWLFVPPEHDCIAEYRPLPPTRNQKNDLLAMVSSKPPAGRPVNALAEQAVASCNRWQGRSAAVPSSTFAGGVAVLDLAKAQNLR